MNVLFFSRNDPVESANAIITVERGAKVPYHNNGPETLQTDGKIMQLSIDGQENTT